MEQDLCPAGEGLDVALVLGHEPDDLLVEAVLAARALEGGADFLQLGVLLDLGQQLRRFSFHALGRRVQLLLDVQVQRLEREV